MPGEDINTTLRFNADITDFKAAMQEATRYTKLANSEFKEVASGLDDWANSTDGLKAKLNQLSTVQQAEERKLSVLKEAYRAVVEEQGENSAAAVDLAAKINNQQSVVNNVAKAHDKFAGELEEVEEAERRAAITGRDASEELEDLRDATKKAGDAAEESAEGWTVMRGAIADVIGNLISEGISKLGDMARSVVDLGMSFTSSMSEVQAISGATGEELKALEATAREYGATTVFSASEAADALKYMALAGWDVQQSTEGLPGVLNLAAASGMDLAAASDMVTDYLSAFSMQASDAAYMADLMAYAQSNANTTAEGLGEAFKNCAANLNAAGQDIETTTAFLSMMANQGLKGSEAGTALTAVVRDMTAKMADGAIAIGDASVAVMDSEGNFRDLTDILLDVEAATQGMGDAERASALMTTFTADSIKGLNLIMNAGVGEAKAFEEELRSSTGTAKEMSDVMNDNLSGDVKEMQSALEELGLRIYESLEEPLRSVVQWITENLNPAFNWIVDNKDVLISAVAGIAAGFVAFKTAAAVTGLISGFTQFFNIIKTGQGVMTALNVVMGANPMGLVAIAIAGLVAAFTLLWQNSDEFRAFWQKLWENIKDAANKGLEAVKKFFTKTVPELVKNVTKWFGELPGKIASAISGAVDKVKTWGTNLYNTAKSKVTQTVSDVTSWFKELPGKIASAIASAVDKVVSWGSSLVSKGKAAASSLVSAVVDTVKSLPGKMVSIGSDLAAGVWEGMSNSLSWIKNKISGWVGNVKDFLLNLFDINSPSGWARDYLGFQVGAGAAVGLEKSFSRVKQSSRKLKGVIADGIDIGPTGSPSPNGVAAGGRTIIFNQTNNSPRELSRREIYRQTHNALAFAGGM